MSTYEFQSANTFIDNFVASHSVIINGVNKQIGTEEASRKIAKVFQQRFGKDKVMSCNTFRKTFNVKKLWVNLQVY